MYLTGTCIGVNVKSNVSIDKITAVPNRGQNTFNSMTHPSMWSHFPMQKYTDICKDRTLALLTENNMLYTCFNQIGQKGAVSANPFQNSLGLGPPPLIPAP